MSEISFVGVGVKVVSKVLHSATNGANEGDGNNQEIGNGALSRCFVCSVAIIVFLLFFLQFGRLKQDSGIETILAFLTHPSM